jgi:photosystem II stability/assembly factor-like uncharacterized protein
MPRTPGRTGSWGLAACAALALTFHLPAIEAQQAAAPARDPNTIVDARLLSALQYRSLGFSRGGRSTAVAGVASQPLVYYFGATGGGVWKTVDAGITWLNVSDGFFETGSIGAIAVAPSDPNVIYVGTGSAAPRGNVIAGVGMYKSTDAGRTWRHVGLRRAGQISKVRVHPTDHNLVYAAVLGNLFGPSEERGVFRSRDGGGTWEKVFYVNERTGASSLSMDATNPRVLYAGMWTAIRQPWTITSGSKEAGVFKSTDGGDTWTRLAGGLPNEVRIGKTAVAVSPARPDRVWALIEADNDRGGLYRSDDAGRSWQRVNSQRMLLQRAWYYIHLHADPVDPERVYAQNTGFYRSTDGGRTFTSIRVPHGDNHDLWINPNDNDVMIESNDGGVNVSMNGGQSWSTQMNQPTAEIYRVTVDTRFPYRVYGAQQDNTTASLSSFPPPSFLGLTQGAAFEAVGGCESGHIAVDPRRPNIVYAGCYGGEIERTDTDTGISENVRTYPELQTGQRAADMKYRFQWNAPIHISPHSPDTVYHTSQYVHRTTDAGHSWEIISPDLTRNDKEKQDYSGGEGITKDNTGVEVYGTVFALTESPIEAGLLWAGSDDGLVHVSRDAGKSWQKVTPADLPEWGTVNAIDASPHGQGRAFIAVHKYRENDFSPYVFRTNDYGRSWQKLTDGRNGIPATHPVRVVREDPDRKGLLYAGTEFGLFVSFDEGAHWQSLQLNLPVTPVTDIKVHQKDLVISTNGRAFWVLDDVSPLHEMTDRVAKSAAHLFTPRTAFRSGTRGASIYYSLAEAPREPIRIEILDAKGAAVASYSSRPAQGPELPPGVPAEFAEFFRGPRVTANAGLNVFTWNMRHDALFTIPRGAVIWGGFGGGQGGPKVVPGAYQVKVTADGWSATKTFEVKPDPRASATPADYEEQITLARRVAARIGALYENLGTLREAKRQSAELGDRIQKAGLGDEIAKAARALADKLTKIEGELTQLQGEGGQDALNFPGRLDNQFIELYGKVTSDDRKPNKGMAERLADINPQLDSLLGQLQETLLTEVSAFNELVRKKNVEPVIVKLDRRQER